MRNEKEVTTSSHTNRDKKRIKKYELITGSPEYLHYWEARNCLQLENEPYTNYLDLCIHADT